MIQQFAVVLNSQLFVIFTFIKEDFRSLDIL